MKPGHKISRASHIHKYISFHMVDGREKKRGSFYFHLFLFHLLDDAYRRSVFFSCSSSYVFVCRYVIQWQTGFSFLFFFFFRRGICGFVLFGITNGNKSFTFKPQNISNANYFSIEGASIIIYSLTHGYNIRST